MPAAYSSPLDDMHFALRCCANIESVLSLPPYRDLTPDIITSILEEGARFAGEMLSPLNASGDRERCRLEGDRVRLPNGFKEAYQAFVQNGWNAAPVAAEHGGQGLPQVVSTLLAEMWHGANMSFGLCPMLTQSAIELLSRYGSPALQAAYLPALVEGRWAGTMCMTEPQAGSDVGAVRTSALPEGDHYRIRGTKIFITYGEHDLTENIIHMVLARLPGAPAGTKGLSLFLVPKILPDESRNDVKCVSLEHKLGIHASPTCVMAFGEQTGAIGYLIGEAHRGMATMFSMMNPARFAVGLEAIGVLGYASQLASAYAAERVQGRVAGESTAQPIDHHADVARMLLEIRSHSEALRALALYTASRMDMARHADGHARDEAQACVDLLIPIVKAHGSQVAFTQCSNAMQVAGGMGYIEESGFPQLLRDVRVTMIYEGTNGIQALDLVQRKLPMQDYRVVEKLFGEIRRCAEALAKRPALADMGSFLQEGCAQAEKATGWLRQKQAQADAAALRQVQSAAASYLSLMGLVTEAYMMGLSALATEETASALFERKRQTARFFMKQILPEAAGLAARILDS